MPAKTMKKSLKPATTKKTAAAAKPVAMKTKTAKPKMMKTPEQAPHAQAKGHGHPSKKGFMWKLLQQKEDALKRAHEGDHKPSTNPHESGFQPHARDKSFSKFQGPRRKIG